MPRFREEVLNVALAKSLVARGLPANAETIHSGALPDVLIELGGLKLVIEGRIETQRKSLLEDSRTRVASGLADLSLAVLYPTGLSTAPTMEDLAARVEAGHYDGAVFYSGRAGIESLPFTGASLDDLADAIRSAFRIRVQNDVVRTQVALVEAGIEEVVRETATTDLWFSSETLVARLNGALGLRLSAPAGGTPASRAEREDLVRISSFILFDAVLFQAALSAVNTSVQPLGRATDPLQRFLDEEWTKILGIDYAPIFGLARDVLQSFPASPNTEAVLRRVIDIAADVASSGVLTKHDFMGRLYHKLLLRTTGRFYATYYTSIPAAWLLASLVYKTPHDRWDFSSPAEVARFRLIDPACGSGTLLSASYMAIRDMYVRARPPQPALGDLHRSLVEHAIYGWDVLDYAAHLTLTTLALHSDSALVSQSNVYTLPVGLSRSGTPHLGSLDFLKRQVTLLGHGFTQASTRQGLEAAREQEVVDPPTADVVIMNPPFSRSAKPNVKFGYSDPLEKKALEEALAAVTREIGKSGIGQAGLGAHFMLLGLTLSAEDGRLAVVIPRSMLSGVAWRGVRDDYFRDCEIEYIVSSFDPGDRAQGIDAWSWSENTSLGEVLVVARRTKLPQSERRTTYVNLWNRPKNEVEALLVASEAIRARGSLTATLEEHMWADLGADQRVVGAAYNVRHERLAGNWVAPCLFASPDLDELVLRLRYAKWPSVTLRDATVSLGRDIKQVKDSFERTAVPTAHRLVWGHQAAMNTVSMAPSNVGYGRPKKGKVSLDLFSSGSSTLLLAERPHLSTEALLAMESPESVLTTAFWEVRLHRPELAPAFLTWFNSTFGILELLACSTSSMGDIIKAKKEQLQDVRMPDPGAFELGDCRALNEAVATVPFLPFAQEAMRCSDGLGPRHELDVFWATHLPDLPRISKEHYRLLGTDPVMTLRRLNVV